MKTVTTLVAAGAIVSSASAVELVNQPYDGITGSFAASEAVVGGFYDTRAADNFSNPDGLTITDISFWGTEEGFFSPDFPGNINSFVIEIFADAGGLPGASVAQETLPVNSVARADTGDDSFNFGDIFRFDADITDVALAPGEYWISIGATPVSDFQNDDSFFLALSSSGDGSRADEAPALSGLWGSVAGDPLTPANLAIVVNGIPAPGSAVLLGAAGIAATRRRR